MCLCVCHCRANSDEHTEGAGAALAAWRCACEGLLLLLLASRAQAVAVWVWGPRAFVQHASRVASMNTLYIRALGVRCVALCGLDGTCVGTRAVAFARAHQSLFLGVGAPVQYVSD